MFTVFVSFIYVEKSKTFIGYTKSSRLFLRKKWKALRRRRAFYAEKIFQIRFHLFHLHHHAASIHGLILADAVGQAIRNFLPITRSF